MLFKSSVNQTYDENYEEDESLIEINNETNSLNSKMKPNYCYLISITLICCLATTELGAALAQSGIAFKDLQFIFEPDFDDGNSEQQKEIKSRLDIL